MYGGSERQLKARNKSNITIQFTAWESENKADTDVLIGFPAHTRRWHNVGLMLIHRLRRRTSIEPALGEPLVFAGLAGPANQRDGLILAQQSRYIETMLF